jgi:arylsulfatase
MYIRWYADNMWLFVPIQARLRAFLGTMDKFPFQEGASLNAGSINYTTLKAMKILKKLENLPLPIGK